MSEVMNKVKSINVASVFDKKTVKENLNKVLFTVHGYARSMIFVDGKYGEQIGFKGDFVAINKITGEVFESEAFFAPKGLSKELEKRLSTSDGQEVKFSADIKATESDKNDKGYAWVADAPKTEAMASQKEALKLAALKEAQSIVALPAPKKRA